MNGLPRPVWNMIVLLMDKEGLPSPFERALYDDLGPRHVVDLLHDGRAQLVDSFYDEDDWDSRAPASCSRTLDYQFSTKRPILIGARVGGVADGMTFPVVNHWTYGSELRSSIATAP